MAAWILSSILVCNHVTPSFYHVSNSTFSTAFAGDKTGYAVKSTVHKRSQIDNNVINSPCLTAKRSDTANDVVATRIRGRQHLQLSVHLPSTSLVWSYVQLDTFQRRSFHVLSSTLHSLSLTHCLPVWLTQQINQTKHLMLQLLHW